MSESCDWLKTGKDMNILIVEDSLVYQQMLVTLVAILKPETVSLATTLKDAESLVTSHDLVLLDLILPDSTPDNTLQQMSPHFKAKEVIVISGVEDLDVCIKAIDLGARFLCKTELDKLPELLKR